MLGECAGSALAWLFEPSSANERLGHAFKGVADLVLGVGGLCDGVAY